MFKGQSAYRVGVGRLRNRLRLGLDYVYGECHFWDYS